ncbi:MAG: DeoR/GlpR family DNA-binding transcription regulator [Actinomycetota bacterium]
MTEAADQTKRRPVRRSERMAAILESLTVQSSVEVSLLATRFAVSEATLRRDLGLLEEQRLLTRTHGGAVAQDLAFELPVRYRGTQRRAEKRAIAEAAAAEVPIGPHVVAFTGGTTTSEVARRVTDHGELTVVTNALNIAMDLVLRPQVKVIVVGGVSRPQSYELVGPWAEDFIAAVNIGTIFVGVDGISARGGLTTHDEMEAATNRAMIDRAERVVVVADSSKLGRVMLARIAALDVVDVLITDSGTDVDDTTAEIDAIRALGVTVVAVTAAPATER